MQQVIGTQHGSFRPPESASSEDKVVPPFSRMFDRNKEARSDDVLHMLQAVADAMNWVDLLKDPSDDSEIPAGYTLLGQFITHDLSFNTIPLGGASGSPNGGASRGAKLKRTPKFDLDSIYAASPRLGVTPPRIDSEGRLTDQDTGEMWYREKTKSGEPDDLPRYVDLKEYVDARLPKGAPISDHQAIIGDVRNDENVLIAQLHLAFLKLHNAFVKQLRDQAPDDGKDRGPKHFAKARELCRQYYQWVVVRDYLPRIVGQDMVDAILKKEIVQVKVEAVPEEGKVEDYALLTEEKPQFKVDLQLYATDPDDPTIPVEFAAAAFRFGHSMIRGTYRVNAAGTQFPLFGTAKGDDRHLGGSRRLPAALAIDWARFFDGLAPEIPLAKDRKLARNKARKIDSYLSDLLSTLPRDVIPERGEPVERSLALRDLQRGVDLELPFGQDVAFEVRRKLKGTFPILSYDLGLYEYKVDTKAPLWFYLLKEAQLLGGGERLGPVGGRIVAEVMLGLMYHDKNSFLTQRPDFAPPGHGDKPFTMADLLCLAGVAKYESGMPKAGQD